MKREAGSENGRLHILLRQARSLLRYDPNLAANDPGLPAVLLSNLPSRVWHTLVAWLAHHDRVSESDRREMIRYALLDYYFSGNASQRLERIPFELAWRSSNGFPGFAIYAALWHASQLESSIIPVEEFASNLSRSEDIPPPGYLFKKEQQLGLWTQRFWLHRWFPNFDPTRYGSSKDLPYDLDHILPSAYSKLRGRTRSRGPSAEFWQWRWRVIYGPGNVRYWPASLNRSDQHKNLAQKHLLGHSDQQTPLDSLLRAYELETVGQVRAASGIGDEELDNWKHSANDSSPYDWHDPERIKALRLATDARRLALYRQFYEGLGFAKWHEKFAPWLADTIRKEVMRIWIDQVRTSGLGEAIFTAQSVAEELGLHDQIEAICVALDAPEFYNEAGLILRQRSGPDIGGEAQWIVKW